MTIRPVALIQVPPPASDKPSSGTRTRRFSYVGTVPQSAIYLEREADRILPDALAAGDFCHVFGPRQIGKSSLRSRVTKKLTARGIRCVTVDMMGLGSSATQDQWFFALVDEIAGKLGLDDPHDFWQRHPDVSPARRWGLYLRHIVRDKIVNQRCVLLLDEIEAVITASFPTDDFFLILRELFEARSEEPWLERLSICLLGVTVPDDLLKEKRSTPYNISRRIHLGDFTRAEMAGLAVGLDDLGVSTDVLLDAVHAWTDGHPYMTMRTCEAIHQRGSVENGEEQAGVEAIVQDLFLAHSMDDANLRYAADRFTDSAFDKPNLPLMEKVLLLRRLLDGERVVADLESPVQMELQLCGMIKGFSDAEGQWVRLRNRIFASVFNVQWLQSRGDRRYLGGAIWKWRESGKKKDYLLRGQALMEAMARDERLWTDEEREFLVEGLKEEVEFVESQMFLGETALLGLKTSIRTFPQNAESLLTRIASFYRLGKSINFILQVAGLFIFVGVAFEFASGRKIHALISGIIGLAFIGLGAASALQARRGNVELNDYRVGLDSLRNAVEAMTSHEQRLAQLSTEGESYLTTLREHLTRLTTSNPKR